MRELGKGDRGRLGHLALDEGPQDGDRRGDDRHGGLGGTKDLDVHRGGFDSIRDWGLAAETPWMADLQLLSEMSLRETIFMKAMMPDLASVSEGGEGELG